MTGRIDELIARVERIAARVDEAEAEARRDGVVTDEEAAVIGRIRSRLGQARDRLTREIARQGGQDGAGLAGGRPVEVYSFEDEEVTGEFTGRIVFAEREQVLFNSVTLWRNNCRDAVEGIATDMLTDRDSGGEIPRGDLVALARTALTLAGQPHVATAVGVANNLFNLAQRAYESSLPSQPSIRDAKDAWVSGFNSMTDARVRELYRELELAFKRANGFPDDAEHVFGTAHRDWIAFIGQFTDGRLLYDSSRVRRDFVTLCYRAMPDSRWDRDLSSGTVEIVLDYDLGSRRFSFDSGQIDDLTDEVRAGLDAPNNPVYGNKVLDLPAMLHFRIDGGGGTICEIWRYARRSGSTDFRLVMRALSPVDLDRQREVFDEFVSSRAYDVDLARVL